MRRHEHGRCLLQCTVSYAVQGRRPVACCASPCQCFADSVWQKVLGPFFASCVRHLNAGSTSACLWCRVCQKAGSEVSAAPECSSFGDQKLVASVTCGTQKKV